MNLLGKYRDEYFKKGSVGLQDFLRTEIGNMIKSFQSNKTKIKQMSKQIMIPFQVTLWDLKAYDEQTNEPTLSRGTVKKSFDTDDFKGESAGEILMYSSAADGSSAAYTVLDKFTVEIEGRKGSFVALHGATRSPAETSRALGKILPNSGTNDLKGISGTIEFVQNESGKKIILDYSFADEN